MITIRISDNKHCIIQNADFEILLAIKKEFSFKALGVEYTAAFRNGWNGITYLVDGKNRLGLGLLEKLKAFLSKIGQDFVIDDHRPNLIIEPEIDLSGKLAKLNILLRDYQERIINTAFEHRKGIVRACTGSGKTLAISALVAKINKPTIIYVIGLDLLGQFHETLTSLFDEEIGYIGNGVCNIKRINVVSIWTIGRVLGIKNNIIDDDSSEKEILKVEHSKEIIELLKSRPVHIFDECHVVSCDTIKQIYKTINPERIYGFSATWSKGDGTDLLSIGILGDQIIDVPASELIEKGWLAKPFIKFVRVPNIYSNARDYHSIYRDCIVENEKRNQLIVENTKMLLDKGYRVLVLFKQIKHGKILQELFAENGIDIEMLSGQDTLERRNKIKNKLQKGKLKAVLASTIFDLGVDITSLSGLVLAGSGKSEIRSMQRIGRIIRKHEGKPVVAVIDFADDAKYIKAHSKARYNTYIQEKGFVVKW